VRANERRREDGAVCSIIPISRRLQACLVKARLQVVLCWQCRTFGEMVTSQFIHHQKLRHNLIAYSPSERLSSCRS
jgi:hypothetical protein